MSKLFFCRFNCIRSFSMLHSKRLTSPQYDSKNSNKKSSSPEVTSTKNEPFNEKQIDFSLLDPDKFGDLSYHYKESTSAAIIRKPLKSESMKDEPDGYDKLEIKRGPKKSI